MTPGHVLPVLLLAGCASQPPMGVETLVRVNVPCDAGPVPAPAFPVDSLTGAETIYAKAQTLAADIEVREGYEARLRAAVDACRPGAQHD